MKDNKIKNTIKKYGKYVAVGAACVTCFALGKKYSFTMTSRGLYYLAKTGETFTAPIEGVDYVLSVTPKQ